MAHLRYILAACVGVVGGLVAYGLAGSYQWAIAIIVGVIGFFAIIVGSHFTMRPDDRDPTIRPSNVPKKR